MAAEGNKTCIQHTVLLTALLALVTENTKTCIEHIALPLQVLDKLRDFVEDDSCRTRILLLPSVRDVHHDPVFPQPPLQSTLPESIQTLTNPATFRVNEVVVGAASPDILKQVSLKRLC